MEIERATEILNSCLELLKIKEKINLDLNPENGIKLSRQAIEYGDILIQKGLYTEASKVGEAGTAMIQYFSEKKIAKINSNQDQIVNNSQFQPGYEHYKKTTQLDSHNDSKTIITDENTKSTNKPSLNKP